MSNRDRSTANIEITGVKQTVAALKAFTPDLYKRLNREIRKGLSQVLKGAQGRYPGGAWQLSISQKRILGSISARNGDRAPSWGDSDPGVKAAIFEFAGSRSQGATPQARGLIESLNRRYGQPGRFLWASWDEQGPGVMEDIAAAVRRAERDLQTRLEAAGDSF